jgi:sigma-E factor negative regulatory protein RseA
MSDERPQGQDGDRQDERDSQLSAMFDGELPAAECELLARRLMRDDVLRSQWSRYALIGAALRKERGVKLDDRIARRVQSQITQEVTYGDSTAGEAARSTAAVLAAARSASGQNRWMRFARPVVGAGIAAGVAAVSILWLGNQESPDTLAAGNGATQPLMVTPEPVSTLTVDTAAKSLPATQIAPRNGEPERYTTPAFTSRPSIVPPTQLANYVVAHSEYSGPLSRRLALLGLVASDGPADVVTVSDSDAAGTNNDAR